MTGFKEGDIVELTESTHGLPVGCVGGIVLVYAGKIKGGPWAYEVEFDRGELVTVRPDQICRKS